MSIEELLQEVQASYIRIKQAEARAHNAYEHYLDDLKVLYTEQLRHLEYSFQQASTQVQVEYHQQLAETHSAYGQVDQQIKAQLVEMITIFLWVVAPWDDPVWNVYEPALDASVPDAVRFGRLALKDVKDFPQLPTLASFIGPPSYESLAAVWNCAQYNLSTIVAHAHFL